jgi:hypothetical protein
VEKNLLESLCGRLSDLNHIEMRFLLIVSGVLDFFFICFFLILTITRKKSAVGDHKLPLFSPQFKQTNLVSSSPSIGPCEHELKGACDEGVGVEGETFSHFTAEQLFFSRVSHTKKPFRIFSSTFSALLLSGDESDLTFVDLFNSTMKTLFFAFTSLGKNFFL